jgi:hypothetical protein
LGSLFYPEDGGSTFFRNVSKLLSDQSEIGRTENVNLSQNHGYIFNESCTVRVISPVRSQQNSQWIWSSPLTEIRTAGCAWVVTEHYNSASHSLPADTAPIYLPYFPSFPLTRNSDARSRNTDCSRCLSVRGKQKAESLMLSHYVCRGN